MPKSTTLDNPEAVFIMHEGVWWRPLNSGYTGDLLRAGVYEPFKPWRNDELVPVARAMDDARLTETERAFLVSRARKDVLAYERKMAAHEDSKP